MRGFFAVFIITLSFLATNICADEISDQIKLGSKAYNDNNFPKAIEELRFAITQITQLQQDKLGSILPAPLKGWAAKKSQAAYMGAAMFGGGSLTSKKYTKDRQSIKIEIVTNSPLLSSMMMMFNNPLFMARKSGSKIMKINGEKAVQEFNGQKGKVTIILDSKIMINVEGRNLSEAKPLMQYAKALNFKAIRKAVNT